MKPGIVDGSGLFTTAYLDRCEQRAKLLAEQLRQGFEWLDSMRDIKAIRTPAVGTPHGAAMWKGYKLSKEVPAQVLDQTTMQIRTVAKGANVPFPHHYALSYALQPGLTEQDLTDAETIALMTARALGAPDGRSAEHRDHLPVLRATMQDGRTTMLGMISISWGHEMRKADVTDIIKDRSD
jgi:hypothetical protein